MPKLKNRLQKKMSRTQLLKDIAELAPMPSHKKTYGYFTRQMLIELKLHLEEQVKNVNSKK